MRGDYRLLRQGGGRTAFAHVYVRILPRSAEDAQIIVAIEPEDNTSVSQSQEPELFAAAVQGCTDILRMLNAEGNDTSNYQIVILRLTINRVDTQPDAVCTAAFLATASALRLGDIYRPVFEGEWKAVRIPSEVDKKM